MTRANRTIVFAARSLGLAAVLFGLAVAPAVAAPSFGVEIQRDAAVVSHSDERVDYTVSVKNISALGGPASAGDLLMCNPDGSSLVGQGWLPAGTNRPVVRYQWLRNGEVIAGETSNFYTSTGADESKPVQCLVTGENAAGASVAASLPAAVVNPPPAIEPPRPSSTIGPGPAGAAKPTIDGTGLAKRTCTPPTNWLPPQGEPDAPVWSFQWLRNAQEIDGAETSEYQPVAADEGRILQCKVVGTNAGGSVVSISNNSIVGTLANPPSKGVGSLVAVIPNPTNATVELPGGEETFVDDAEGDGWICRRQAPVGAQHAEAICASRNTVAPGGSYPPLTVTAALDRDAPDLAVATATVSGGGSPQPAVASDEFIFAPEIPFGVTAFEGGIFDQAGDDYTQAGGHPFSVGASWTFSSARGSTAGSRVPIGHIKRVITDAPRGFVGNALSVPELCPTVEDVIERTCPDASVVGTVVVNRPGSGALKLDSPIFALEPEYGLPIEFAFSFTGTGAYIFYPRLRAEDSYAISFELAPASEGIPVLAADVTLCGFGTKPNSGTGPQACREASDPEAIPIPLITNATRCAGDPPLTTTRADSWENPDHFVGNEFSAPPVTGCEEVHFEPEADLQPTSHRADSPTGLDVDLAMPTDGLESKTGISQASMKRARITFPRGMAVNASAGHGLGSCSADQVRLKTNDPISCPDSSKVGTVEIDTPLIREPLKGSVYVAKQGDVGGALLGMYLVFESPRDGILIKVPARVDPDPVTGQLVATVDESPEAPFSAVRTHFFAGPRATLLTPPRCGRYEIKTELSPWTAGDPDNPTPAETVTQTSNFEITEGPGGGPCPSGSLDPKLNAGTQNPTAGKASPFTLRLSREDGSDRFTALSVTFPPGLIASLRGIPYCPDSVLASIPTAEKTGQAQIENPSCPAASQIGTVIAGAGAGPDPFYVDTGRAYLAGPYKGAPLSLAVVAPAVAGPLDLGNVVVRNAIYLNPETAQARVVSDPVPTILHGLLLDVRDIRVEINRPGFMLNPTNCEPHLVGAEVRGESGASVGVSNRFQVGGCENLTFRPKLGVRLFGATHRGAFPRLRGTITAKPGEANIGRAVVTIPRSEFLEQGHIRTICTRVQFAAKACPAGSIYGHARAWTPLLDYPVEGPVYLRSSSHELPDLAVALRGPDYQPVEAVVVGRVDSIKGQIRTTFDAAPDVPLEKFVLDMQGGKKGLLVNSREICESTNRATVQLEGHNGMTYNTRPMLINGKCKKERKAKRKHRRHR